MAKLEGWSTKEGSKWKTMPELMIRYRAAAFFGRQYCPDLLLGLMTTEEARDIVDVDYAEIPTPTEETKNETVEQVQETQEAQTASIEPDIEEEPTPVEEKKTPQSVIEKNLGIKQEIDF